MSLPSYIVKRQGSRNFYVRVPIPKDLQTRLGTPDKPRRERWQSLNTSDPAKARLLGRPIIEQWEREFQELRQPKPLTQEELQGAIWKRYVQLITADEKFRLSLPTDDDIRRHWNQIESEFGDVWDRDSFWQLEALQNLFSEDQRDRAVRLAETKAEVARGETRSVAAALLQIAEERRLNIDPSSPEYRKFANGVQRAEIEALNRASERDAGDWSGEPKDKLVQPSKVSAHPPGEGIIELFDRFSREAPGRVSPDGWDQNRKIVLLFDQFVGGNAHISQLNRKTVRAWKAELFKWPRRVADTSAFRGLSFSEVIAHNKKVGKPVISPKTINKYLAGLGGFSSWLLSNGYLDEHVMTGMFLELDRSKKQVFPFDQRKLDAIFSSPLFRRCEGDGSEHVKGGREIRDWRYWLPWLALYSGARLGELAQLLVSDVRQEHGQWIFHVTTEGSDAKRTKTGGSQRVVPVHSRLIQLGFDKYHARAVAFNRRQLFDIKPDTRGYFSGEPSKFFGSYLRAIGIKTGRDLNFHSFRHTAADAFRRAGYSDEEFAPLFGHTRATMTGKYGIIKPMVLAQRVTMIESIDYPGLR
ncbi:site-specific integrase [Bradyrhizobium sp. F1.13.3]|uniref:site-specific integrase n=1 Tax=Bradyrhizobium sp. F1.13.3 TaxID=3156351 RepID=UPI00339721F0